MTDKIKKPQDIPGQESDHPPKMKATANTTASSGNEEEDDASDVSAEEAALLEKTADSQAGPEDEAWQQATLDNTDADGEELNEENEFSGKDLDVPGSEDDDANEDIGEEDEENNSFSRSDQDD